MRALLVSLALVCAPRVYAIQVEGAPSLPAIRAFAVWLNNPPGYAAAAAFDARVANLGVLASGTAAADAAALPLAEQFLRMGVSFEDLAKIADLPAERQRELVRDAAVARGAASPYVRESIMDAVLAGKTGKLSVESLQKRRELWRHLGVYGAGPREALGELNRIIEDRIAGRVKPLLQDPFPHAAPVEPVAAPESSRQPERLQPPTPQPPKKRSNIAVRATTAVVLVPGVVAAAHFGGPVFLAFTTALSGLMAFEFGGLLAKGGKAVDRLPLAAGAAATALAVALGFGGAALAAGITLFAAREVLRKEHSVERLAFAALGLLLFGFLPAHLALLRALPLWGEKLTLLALVSTWAADTTAMFLGRAIGRTKLAPFLSPNKTWEGAFAGFLACLACAAAFNWLWPGLLGWGGALAFAAVMGGLGQLAGLLNSMIKRLNGAKDSGTLLPGHGGFIDRFDAYLLAAAAVYALARVLGA